MTMYLTRAEAFREAAWEREQGIAPATFGAMATRLRQYTLAAQPRGYLWFPLLEGTMELHEADALLAEVAKPEWSCTWFPRSWLSHTPPWRITASNVRTFVLPECLRDLPSFPAEWFDEDEP